LILTEPTSQVNRHSRPPALCYDRGPSRGMGWNARGKRAAVRFVLVEKIVEIEPGRRARGYRTLSPDADYYRDHMPGYPVEPGVLILESMAQLGGRLVQQSVRQVSGRDVLPMLAMVKDAQFRRPVRPPCRLELSAEIQSIRATGARVTAAAQVDGESVASATITYALVGLDHDTVGIGPENLSVIREWGQRTWDEMTSGTAADGAAKAPAGPPAKE
jgi:3-hydroxyacyl-[acyl-carrier-protein] dehydratase